jgi:threonine aldolase
MKPVRSFASDNNAGVHPEILAALGNANHGHTVGYGDDAYTATAVEKFREHFGADAEVFFVFNGTAANVLSLQAMTRPHHAVVCTDVAHIHTDECGAPERFTGCKLITLPSTDGKLTVQAVRSVYHGIGDEHHVQPKVVAITQATETGRVYQPSEIKALAEFAHAHNMFVHMDGARLANAAAALNQNLRQATRDLGVDILSFGGTKNGLMGGEAVVFLNSALAENFKFIRKQAMQLASKMRFIAVQFETLLTRDLWLKGARHANAMARLLEAEVRKIEALKIAYPVEANGVFVIVPQKAIEPIRERYFFYVWNEETSVVRWMCSFDTTEEDVREFTNFVRECLR